ncbi:unnamed protein product [Linum trigynum]|uniref:Uncharacterized protein n=1 Tax=Linum trigynum TaxID=586398 RepID=A0AAV2GIJ8_9ROSI
MLLAFRLHKFHVTFPPAPFQQLAVMLPSRSQEILLRHHNQHVRAAQPGQVRLERRVQIRVVQPGRRRRAGQQPEPLPPIGHLSRLVVDRFLPGEIRVDQDQPGQPRQPLYLFSPVPSVA